MEQQVDFVATLMELKSGRAQIDCSRKLAELVAAVRETSKAGKLVLELRIVPSGFKEGRVYETEVTWMCRIQKPEHALGKSIFFVARDGTLSRNDPDQAEMFEVEPKRENVDGK
jgi:hypothetical protein